MSGGGFRRAVIVAVGAHLAFLLAMTRVPKAPGREESGPKEMQELVFVNEEEVVAPVVTPATPPEPAAATEAVKPALGRPRGAIAAAAPATSAMEAQRETAPAPAGTETVAPAASQAPVNLGVGDYWKSVALGAPAATEAPVATTEAARDPNRILRDALDESDHARGIGPAGPVVAAAHEAASIPAAPDTGTAMFEVESDANGVVTRVTLIDNGATDEAWKEVGKELLRLMAAKRLHVPAGAHGVRARVKIGAERTLPAGEKLTRSVGAVPDDLPTGEKACVGEGIHRKCTAGSPLGASGTWGDLSNIGARRTRAVHVAIVKEGTY